MAAPDFGYVTDVPYMRHFVSWMAPARLDFVALLSGIEPPDRRNGFSWCELGCGYADTGTVLAATHPNGIFHGIDLMPENIRDARRLGARAGIANLTLHALDFADATGLEFPRFDYIVAHGVYSWIEDAGRDNFRRFIARHLAPGGLVAVSYNAMPGWAADQVFQFLARALAESAKGDSMSRYRAAEASILRLAKAGAPALKNSPLVTTGLRELHKLNHPAYFPLEYLQPGWRAFYVTEMRSQFAEIGLEPVGPARIAENFDFFVLRRGWRDALAKIAEPNSREVARDYFLHQELRQDVFGRGGRQIGDRERRRRLAACVFGLTRPASLVEYEMSTAAGTLRFDNPVARRIVAALADGPRPLAEIAARRGSKRDVLACALALSAAGMIRPVGPGAASVTALNSALSELGESFAARPYVAMPFGTAIGLEPELWRHLWHRGALPARLAAWPDFLAQHLS